MQRMNRTAKMVKIAALCFVLCLSVVSVAQQPPTLVSYPSYDSGWTFTGNVTPIGCIGPCPNYNTSNNSGSPTQGRTMYDVSEKEGYEEFSIQSTNCQGSEARLSFSVPTTGTYYVAVATQSFNSPGPGNACNDGHSYWPVFDLGVNGNPTPLCRYPDDTNITCTTFLTLDQDPNGGYGRTTEYVVSGAVSLYAGTNTLFIDIVGAAHGYGGYFDVGNVVIWPTSTTLEENCGCRHSDGVTWSNAIETGGDIFALNTACRSYATASCSSGASGFNNLQGGTQSNSGCSGGYCRMLDLD